MKRILGLTGIRSDYDIMSALYRKLAREPAVDFRLLVGGAHLSRTYGHTIDEIRNDAIPVLLAVESLLDSDTKASRIKSASILLQGAVDSLAAWEPDLIVYAGDREEVWIGALLGAYLAIPTVHFYGGDHTITGHVDNPVRHAASKLSTAHLVSIEEHKQRLIAMGESESRIFVIGNLSLDNFVANPPEPFEDVRRKLGIADSFSPYALVLFHPDPSESELAERYMLNILECLGAAGISACVGYPNTDPSNRSIIRAIQSFSGRKGYFIYRNLDRQTFIDLYKHAAFIIGNSSSGIMEAASIPIPAVNVGLRQRGRLAGKNVVFCDADQQALARAVETVTSESFRSALNGMENPYGDGRSADRACRLLLERNFGDIRLKTEDPLRPGKASVLES